MNKKALYEYFIGLISLMYALMLIIELFISVPEEVTISFYYVENIIRLIFIGDVIARFAIAKGKKTFIIKNIIDLISIISLRMYILAAKYSHITILIKPYMVIKLIKAFMIVILIYKFKIKVKDEIRKNKFNFLIVISVIIIVIGAVIISIIEGISLADALWWSFVTFTTVGYGDVLLKTPLGKTIAVLLMIIGIGVIGVITTTLTLYIVNGERRKSRPTYKDEVIENIKEKLDNYEELTNEDLDFIISIIKSLKK